MNDSTIVLEDAAPTGPVLSDTPKKRSVENLFAAFWRWHFYAALLVIPAFLVLSLSGLAMLYKAQIDPLFHPGVIVVDVPASSERLLLSQQMASVTEAFPDRTVVSVTDGAGGTATIFATTVDDGLRNVYVNPYTAQVTGDLAPLDLFSNFASSWHKNFTAGDFGAYAMELAASWSIVMAITGYYLFFKGRKLRANRQKRKAGGAKVTSVHAWVGAIAGIGILALVLSGLPWTILWGATVQNATSSNGGGLWGADPGAESNLGDRIIAVDGTVSSPGWAISQGTIPESAPAVDPTTGVVSIDVAAEAAAAEGIPQPFFIAFPDGETGVYSVMGDQWHDNANPSFQDVSLEAAAHVDQYSGTVIATYGYWDYSAAAQTVSQGIAMHEGRRFGAFSSFISTMFCLAILFLCSSSPIMWWRRRKGQKGLQAPKGKLPVYSSWALAVILVALAIFLPVFGVSVVVILLLDLLVIRRIPALKRALSSGN